MTSEILTPAVTEWAGRAAPGTRVARCSVRPLAGGAVARQVDQMTLHLTGHHDPLELVRKQALAHEIAGLRAAQAVRRQATAIPELVAWGGDWLITPLAPRSVLALDDRVPVHPRCRGRADQIGQALGRLRSLADRDGSCRDRG